MFWKCMAGSGLFLDLLTLGFELLDALIRCGERFRHGPAQILDGLAYLFCRDR
ncbi:hypothetical protein D9M69_636380 [compost metagenome]